MRQKFFVRLSYKNELQDLKSIKRASEEMKI